MRSAAAEGSRLPFFLLAAVHLAGCLYYFPPREIFSGEPLLTSDYVLHFNEAVRARDYLRHGSFLGYSTTWMAGFPDGFAGMIKNKPFLLAVAATPPPWQPLAFNLAVLLSLWAVPALVYATARELGRDRRLAAVSMGLAIAAWYGSGLFRVFWRGGSVLFVVGCGLALWATARLWRVWMEPAPGRSIHPVTLGAAAVLWVHPAAALVTIVGGAIGYVATYRRQGLRPLPLLSVGLGVLALNLPWIYSYVRHRDLLGSLYYPIYQGGLANFVFDFVRGPLGLGRGPREEVAMLGPLVLGALAAGAARGDPPGLRQLLGGVAAALAVLAYAGHHLQAIATLQPYRFAIPLALVLAVAAAPLAGSVFRNDRSKARIALALAISLLLANRLRSSVVHTSDYLGAGLGKTESWALEALRAAAGPDGRVNDGRVLLEGEWLSEPVEGRPSARRVSYAFLGFERYLGGEFIGAEATGIGLRENHVSFWYGRLFGRPLAEYDRPSFLRACDLYDVRWIVTARDETKRTLEGFAPGVAPVAEHGSVGIFRVERPPSRLWSGEGRATGDGGVVRFTTETPAPAIVKYHWLPGLAAVPDAELGPAAVDSGSPSPFLEIRPPHAGTYAIAW